MLNLKLFDLLSGYFEKLIFLLISFPTFGLTPNADSFADSFMTFLSLDNLDFPGL
jgi:hypothetical protein